MKLSMTARAAILCICFLVGAGIMARDSEPAKALPRESLSTLPMTIGPWSSLTTTALRDDVREELRVSDYVNRTYINGDDAMVGLYIGYHPNGGVHSPKNCMPGSGWTPVKSGRVDIDVQSAGSNAEKKTIHVNQVVIVKGLDKQVALYWYQGCGRVIASEYWGLIYGMIDKMRMGRTDVAIVRIISPASSLEPEAEEMAGKNAVDFTKQIFPLLSRYIPN